MRERARKFFSSTNNAKFSHRKSVKNFLQLGEKEEMEISLPLIFSRAINENIEVKNIGNIKRKHSKFNKFCHVL